MPPKTASAEPSRGHSKSIAFGLVNVPVKIKPIDAPKKKTGLPSRSIMCKTHGEKMQQQFYCPAGDHYPEKSFAFNIDGKWIELDDDVLEQHVAERTASLVIDRFVPVDQIDPIYYGKSYLVYPDSELGGAPYYDLLGAAMRDTGMAACGNTVLTGGKSETLVVVRWSETAACLVAHACKYDEQIAWNDILLVADGIAARPAPAAANLQLAEQIVQGLAGSFDPAAVTDTYKEAVAELLKQAAAGQPVTAPKPQAAPAAAAPDDLMTQLQRSIQAAKSGAPKTAAKPKAKPKAKAKAKAA